MEKLLRKRFTDPVIDKNLVPDYQFWVRRQHSRIEQVVGLHRAVDAIIKPSRRKLDVSLCNSTLLLDVGQYSITTDIKDYSINYKINFLNPYAPSYSHI